MEKSQSVDHDARWLGTKVLITGIFGFLAGHLARQLHEKGAVVYGVARQLTRRPTTLDLFGLTKKINVERCDVVDEPALYQLIAREKITHVFHLAAISLVDTAVRAHLATFQTNLQGAAAVCSAAQRAGVAALVVSTSDKAYGRFPGVYVEGTPMQAAGFYESSKLCEDVIVQAYALNLGLNAATIRAGNMFGPGDLHPSRIVPRTTMRLLEGLSPTLRPGQGDVLRTYCAVDDVARAFLDVSRHITDHPVRVPPDAHAGEVVGWNVGTDNHFTARQMIEKLTRIVGGRPGVEQEPERPDRLVELPDQKVDSAKLRRLTGWRAREDFDAYLEQTVAWYKEHRDVLRPLFIDGRELPVGNTP